MALNSGAPQGLTHAAQPTRHGLALAALTTLFFMWGFITCLNDILIPYLRGVFELTIFQSTLVQFAFFGAYFIGSLVYFLISQRFGDPIAKMGYKKGLIIGLVVAAVGCLLFYPAAEFRVYGLFLGALFVLALGLTLLQIAANPYVALLGSADTASSRLNMAQGFNSFGTTIAPVLGGYLIFEYFMTADSAGADAVKVPYLGLALGFLLLALMIGAVRLPTFTTEEIEPGAGALRYPHLVKGIFAIFFYVGAEVAIGSMLIFYLELPEIAGLTEAEGSKFLAFYWGGAMTGRFLGTFAMGRQASVAVKVAVMLLIVGAAYVLITLISGIGWMDSLPFVGFALANLLFFMMGRGMPGKTLGVFALGAILLLAGAIGSSGTPAMWMVVGIGLFNSIMWSNIFTLAIDGLGKYTAQGSSLLVMAILGGALITPLQGLVSEQVGVQLSFLVPIGCYAYICYYGFWGSRK
jgi:MFS transporter, FHS family, L-fucose permease